MIDGAHVLTPGVLRFGMLGLSALCAGGRQQRSSGTSAPASRTRSLRRATTEGSRTGSSNRSQWPVDGYRLFDIGHFIGGRDWFDGQWESNCIFVPHSLLDQVGAMDHDFTRRAAALRTWTSSSA